MEYALKTACKGGKTPDILEMAWLRNIFMDLIDFQLRIFLF